MELGRDLEFQKKLHDEVNAHQDSAVYDSMPLLNAFIKV
jgi:hypothetical protein